MRNILSLLACTLVCVGFSGCRRDRWVPGAGAAPTALNVLVMGQSNAGKMRYAPGAFERMVKRPVNWYWHGEDGVSIRNWSPESTYYKKVLDDTKGKQIDLILWYQGEQDGLPGYDHADWAYLFTNLVADWRKQLGDIPVIYAQIAETNWSGFIYWDDVKAQQASVSIPDCVMIKTDDIHPNPLEDSDGIHFSPEGVAIVNHRFGEAFNKLMSGS